MSVRILYLVPDLYGPPGGIARHGRIVCRALLAAGAEVEVVSLHDRDASVPVPSGMTYVACSGSRRRFATGVLRAAARSPDLILLEHPHFSSLGFAAARVARAPLVVFAHGIDIWNPLSWLRKWSLQHADLILCVSRFTAERAIQSNGCAPEKTNVLYDCLDPDLTFQLAPEVESVNPSLLTVGRIALSERYKGHEAVIRTLPTLLNRYPTLTYDVVGDGDGRSALERLAAETGVKHAVRFHGFVTEQGLASFYTRASIFVMPSWGEGFGLAFIEAMAHGKPVIAGNRDASPEVVRDQETGLIIDPTDLDQLAAAVSRLLDDPVLQKRLGTRGAEVAVQGFGFDVFQRRLFEYLNAMLGGRGRLTMAEHTGQSIQS